MSFTAGLWVACFALLVPLSFLHRPAWAVALYMLTFFAAPHLWWWGDDVPDLRYALISGFVLTLAVLVKRTPGTTHRFSLVHAVAIGVAVNATLVHFLIASRPSVSVGNYVELLKYVLLLFMMWRAIEDKRDLRIVVIAIALGAAYIGYEVTINERGYFSGGRLEGVGAPGADSANSLASVMLVTLPLTGSLFVNSSLWTKLVVVVSAPLALNVLLLCNSRGAFLGLIGAAASFLVVARGATRKSAFKTLALGAVTLFFLLGDPEILERFATTFVGSEDRDQSAASRIEFWKAGLLMLSDYPLGDGGGAFKYIHGGHYLSEIAGLNEDRSLHNGYLTEATSWGIQGLTLQLLMIGTALTTAYITSNRCRLARQVDGALIGVCVIVAQAGFMIHCMFGSFLGNEWGYWLVALLVRYAELYRESTGASSEERESVAA